MTVRPVASLLYVMLQVGPDLPPIRLDYLGARGFTGGVMLAHMFFAQLFIGFAIGSPLLKALGDRWENERMRRLSYSLDRFNVLTFSIGATLAGMFLVLLMGFYPRLTTAIFTHFFWYFPVLGFGFMFLTLYSLYIYHYRTQRRSIWAGIGMAVFIVAWESILTGIDSFMTTGGGSGETALGNGTVTSNPAAALDSLLNPMFVPLDLHRTFANLSWPAFALATWAAFSYAKSKSAEDKAFYDWAGSMGVLWGTVFLLFQPFAGFLVAFSMKAAYGSQGPGAPGGPYERLTGSGAGHGSFTSDLLFVNLALVVGLFVLANAAMYLGAYRHPNRAGRVPIRIFGLVAAVAGLYSVSPLAEFPFLYMRYIMMLVMVLATLGTLIYYTRARGAFRYGSPGRPYRAVLLALGTLAAVLSLGMGFMKSNSRVPYTIYGQPEYRISNERPIGQDQLQQVPKPQEKR